MFPLPLAVPCFLKAPFHTSIIRIPWCRVLAPPPFHIRPFWSGLDIGVDFMPQKKSPLNSYQDLRVWLGYGGGDFKPKKIKNGVRFHQFILGPSGLAWIWGATSSQKKKKWCEVPPISYQALQDWFGLWEELHTKNKNMA